MKRYAVLAVFLSACVSLPVETFAFSGPDIPREVPFTENDVTYTSYIQTWHPWYNQSYICYFPGNLDPGQMPIVADYNQGPPYQHAWVILNPASLSQAWDSAAYHSNTYCYWRYGYDWIALTPPVPTRTIHPPTYTWFDWNYSGPTGYDMHEDLIRVYGGVDLKVNFSYNWNGQFGLPNLSSGDYVLQSDPIETPLSFPLSSYTAYTAEVSSVMDHSMTTPYTKDGTVLAFNGEEGNVDNGCWCYSTSSACNSSNYTSCTVAGFMKEGGSNFLVGIINYSDAYLYYDGHPGYDYPMASGTYIYAPANGTLCVATSVTQQPQPSDVWRDAGHCPLSTAGSTTWSGFHTFYIIHEGLYINGSTNDYMTVFLHSNDLESAVRADVEQYGYVQVTKNQHVANVGSVGSGRNHMHLEVYKKSGENWDRVDPYGDGTNNILWEQN